MRTVISDLRKRAFELSRRIVLVDGEDERVLAACDYVAKHSLLTPVLIGDEGVIRDRLRSLGLSVKPEVINPYKSDLLKEFSVIYQQKMRKKGKAVPNEQQTLEKVSTPSYFASMLLDTGRVDGLVGGSSLPTAVILKAALEVIGLSEDAGIVSGTFAIFLQNPLPSGQQVLLFSDCAVVPDPDSTQLAAIGMNAVKIARNVVGIDPVVAFLSFSTKGSAQHPLIDKVVRAKEIFKERLPDIIVEGEIQADAALIPEVARKKLYNSPLQGQANVLVFPDLNAGNIAYKLVERLARAKALGVILEGFSKPVNDLSRGCSVDDVIDMICVTALQNTRAVSHHRKEVEGNGSLL